MIRMLSAATVGVVLSTFTFLLLTGHYIDDGPVLVSVTRRHGVHEGDLFVVAAWALAMAALVVVVRRGRPPAP